MNNFRKRISYHGDLVPLLTRVCKDFALGDYQSHEVVPIGYEDLNIAVQTENGKYFTKLFGSFRGKTECERYISVISRVLEAGVAHPALYKSKNEYIYEALMDGTLMRLCVMEYIEGNNFLHIQGIPSCKEMCFVIKQASLINRLLLRPSPVYDSWSPVNFLQEYEKRKSVFSEDELQALLPVTAEFASLSLKSLPHCFVHGDLIRQNVLKSRENELYLVDFSVANYYPRIHELAILLSDLFFDPANIHSFSETYSFAVKEYEKSIKITPDEHKMLPAYIYITQAMFFLRATYEKRVNNNSSAENKHLLRIGKIGLEQKPSFLL